MWRRWSYVAETQPLTNNQAESRLQRRRPRSKPGKQTNQGRLSNYIGTRWWMVNGGSQQADVFQWETASSPFTWSSRYPLRAHIMQWWSWWTHGLVMSAAAEFSSLRNNYNYRLSSGFETPWWEFIAQTRNNTHSKIIIIFESRVSRGCCCCCNVPALALASPARHSSECSCCCCCLREHSSRPVRRD